jgi:Flp pilus assembly protein TadD
VLAHNPDHLPALTERAKVALDAQQPAEAEEWLRKAEALAPNDQEVLLTLARTLLRLGRAEDARWYQDRFLDEDAQRSVRRRNMLSDLSAVRPK